MAGNEFDPFDLDSFDFGDFDSLDTGVNVQNQPVATPDVSNIVTSLKKRAMVVFFVVDISGSMRGARIGAVNDAIRNVLPELKKRERGNTAAEIRIAVLEFSTRANWRTLSPEPVATFQYQDIENVGGGTNYGTAFAALNEKLSRKQFLNATAGAYTPLIIFMTDGKPSDMGLYKEELARLKQNKWFQYSTRAGIAIEEGALSPECKRFLMEFTENDKNVYEAKNTVILATDRTGDADGRRFRDAARFYSKYKYRRSPKNTCFPFGFNTCLRAGTAAAAYSFQSTCIFSC